MYEYGMRLGQEVAGLKGLQKQAKCYLASMNALRLVDQKYAWIVKPVAATTEVSRAMQLHFLPVLLFDSIT